MSATDSDPSNEELEEKYSDDATYTVVVNNNEYELNLDAREAIQTRAKYEYKENEMFSCWWKVASPDQYTDDAWENAIHDQGDPVLVIETRGPMVPWERMDTLNVEMQEVGPQSQLDGQMDNADTSPDQHDNGNGVRTIDPDDMDDETKKEIGRTHFAMTPKSFEEVPDPDGEEQDKIPPKPIEMDDEPMMVAWVPNHPDIDHTWAAGEAISPMFNRVEWNVQKKADQPRLTKDKDSSHDHWESLLKSHDCQVVKELQASQQPPKNNDSSTNDDVPKHFKEGKYGGGHWNV